MLDIGRLITYFLSFFLIWFGAGLIIKSVDKIAKSLHIGSFTVAFFILGLLTSIPETAIGINAVMDQKPEIFVGTLLGGSVVIFLLIIPLLALIGRGVRINHNLSAINLKIILVTIALPGLAVIDHKVTNLEGLALVIAYFVAIFTVQKQSGWLKTEQTQAFSQKAYSFIDLIKVALGIAFVIISSHNIVLQTIEYSNILSIPSFYLSLLLLSIGSNLPELSLAIQSVISGKKDIAFGDYLGSAAANTLLFGIFTLANNGEVFTFNSFYVTLVFLVSGLVLFYIFSKSERTISTKEGLIMLFIYVSFLAFEIYKGYVS